MGELLQAPSSKWKTLACMGGPQRRVITSSSPRQAMVFLLLPLVLASLLPSSSGNKGEPKGGTGHEKRVSGGVGLRVEEWGGSLQMTGVTLSPPPPPLSSPLDPPSLPLSPLCSFPIPESLWMVGFGPSVQWLLAGAPPFSGLYLRGAVLAWGGGVWGRAPGNGGACLQFTPFPLGTNCSWRLRDSKHVGIGAAVLASCVHAAGLGGHRAAPA